MGGEMSFSVFACLETRFYALSHFDCWEGNWGLRQLGLGMGGDYVVNKCLYMLYISIYTHYIHTL